MNLVDPSGESGAYIGPDRDDLVHRLYALCAQCVSGHKKQRDCRNRARDIAYQIEAAWYDNYGKGPRPFSKVAVGGWMCYEWATTYHKIGTKCGGKVITTKTRVIRGKMDHVYTRFCAGPRTNKLCCVDLDDGIMGGGYCHKPGWIDSRPGYKYVPGEEAVEGTPMDLEIHPVPWINNR